MRIEKGCGRAILALAVLACSFPALAQLPGGTLDPTTVPKFVTPLVIPPVMPAAGARWDPAVRKFVPYYEIEVVQFRQQVLPAGLPQTTVWSYGAVGRPETRNYPAFTIEALSGLPTRVKWVNNLVDASGNYLPHLLPIDQTIHWANPGQLPCAPGEGPTDCRPLAPPQTPYTGPVPIITHVHGAHVQPDSDGFPEAWFLPDAANIPATYATRGKMFDQIPGAPLQAGAATFQYRNDQPATTLWYHDHTLGMTRANVYAGPAGFYLVREPSGLRLGLPGPAPLPGLDPNGNPRIRRLIREIPIAIQDRSFNADGSLFYPDNREFFEGLAPGDLANLGISFTPQGGSDIAPIWQPEFFGNAMVVNGKTWPFLDVEQRRYRLRLLNGCNSRFLILRFDSPALAFQQVGGDQGFLPAPVTSTELLMAPAERMDVVVDFSALPAGTIVTLVNVGPDEPFGGGVPGVDFAPADPGTTGLVMQFRVGPRVGPDLSRVPAVLPAEGPLPPVTAVRRLSLNEEMSANQVICFDELGAPVACDAPDASPPEPFGPAAAKLGGFDAAGNPLPMMWKDAVTENPALGATETWELYNFTADAHPIHIHLVRFKVKDRQPLVLDAAGNATPVPDPGVAPSPPEPGEAGYKDTVIAYPGQVTRVSARFDIPGLFVWHCHIVEHEDNEMMRPFCVGQPGQCPLPLAP
jgi:FtsP/CotA-like multicopper oxidase with cupredoxin domain